MEQKKKTSQNSFGRRLERLLVDAGVKNATIASALRYDVSYVSKWITGRSIPSAKNIEKILGVISHVLIEETDDTVRDTLMSEYGVRSEGALQEALTDYLLEAYYEVAGGGPDTQYVNNAVFMAAPKRQSLILKEYAETLDPQKPTDMIVMVDLFALDHISKLWMAGIEDQKFVMHRKREDLKIDYVIDISNLNGSEVYHIILLIHMMTCFSLANFRLYYNPLAKDKMVVAVKDEYAGVSLLGENQQMLCTTAVREKRIVNEMYDSVANCIDPDKAIFYSVDMQTLLLSHTYLQMLLSGDVKWLVGHMTEHFITPQLHTQLTEQYLGKDTEEAKEAERAYRLASSMLKKNQIRVMLYQTALMDFILSGELDFLNHKVILTPEQRKEQLLYFLDMIRGMEEGTVKLIRDYLSEDFKYITNPCMFLSGSVDYLRLENQIYQDNLLTIKNESIKQIFGEFFDRIWQYDEDVIISNAAEIHAVYENLVEKSDLLTDIPEL